jgi:transposase
VEKEYGEIAKRAEKENGEIYFGDETGVSNIGNYERGYAPRNNPPVLKVETHKERENMLCAVAKNGKTRYTIYEQKLTQQELIRFMRRLLFGAKKKIFLGLDNLRVHHGKIVQKWLEEHKTKIEVFYFPSYSPELNPAEYLNCALKTFVHSNEHPRNIEDIKHKIRSFMSDLQFHKSKCVDFFRHPRLCYIF